MNAKNVSSVEDFKARRGSYEPKITQNNMKDFNEGGLFVYNDVYDISSLEQAHNKRVASQASKYGDYKIVSSHTNGHSYQASFPKLQRGIEAGDLVRQYLGEFGTTPVEIKGKLVDIIDIKDKTAEISANVAELKRYVDHQVTNLGQYRHDFAHTIEKVINLKGWLEEANDSLVDRLARLELVAKQFSQWDTVIEWATEEAAKNKKLRDKISQLEVEITRLSNENENLNIENKNLISTIDDMDKRHIEQINSLKIEHGLAIAELVRENKNINNKIARIAMLGMPSVFVIAAIGVVGTMMLLKYFGITLPL